MCYSKSEGKMVKDKEEKKVITLFNRHCSLPVIKKLVTQLTYAYTWDRMPLGQDAPRLKFN